MARFGFSTNDWREYFDDPSVAIVDPTKAPAPAIDPGPPVCRTADRRRAGGAEGGGAAARATSIWSRREYQFVANGSYEGPWGLNFGANLVTRQGYAEPFFQSSVFNRRSARPQERAAGQSGRRCSGCRS